MWRGEGGVVEDRAMGTVREGAVDSREAKERGKVRTEWGGGGGEWQGRGHGLTQGSQRASQGRRGGPDRERRRERDKTGGAVRGKSEGWRDCQRGTTER